MKEVHGPGEARRARSSRPSGRGARTSATRRVYVERLLVDPRHVEVQVLADAHGNVIHLGERDCTIQRRHQKLVEETPSPAVDAALRARIGEIAVDAARAAGYRSAGTIEGLLDGGRRVLLHGDEHAHPGRAHRHRAGDGARPRARAGAGRRSASRSPSRQEHVGLRGHAIECRINAEDPRPGLPALARGHHAYREPAGPGVRVDSGVGRGQRDLGALRPDDREADRPRRGPRACAAADAPRARRVRDRRVRRRCSASTPRCSRTTASSQADTAQGCSSRASSRRGRPQLTATAPRALPAGGRDVAVRRARRPPRRSCGRSSRSRRSVSSPRRRRERGAAAPQRGRKPGRGRLADAGNGPRRFGRRGRPGRAGDVICIVEAMKMENEVRAPGAGRVTDLSVAAGDPVSTGQVICVLELGG